VLLFLSCLPVNNTAAQQQASVPIRTLGQPVAEHPEGFTRIAAIRELSDGRVIVVDDREQRLELLDFRTGDSRSLARRGRGPLEFASLGPLLPTRADTSLLVDVANSRLLVLGPQGRPVRSVSIGSAVTQVITGGLAAPSAVDSLGRLYDARAATNSGTAVIRRFAHVGAQPETIATIATINARARSANTETTVLVRTATPYHDRDEWGVARDGTVMIARAEEYRVDVVGTDGRLTRGTPIPHRRHRITAEDRAAYMDRLRATMAKAGVNVDIPEPAFPEYKPVFMGPVLIAPNYQAWIQLTPERPNRALVHDVVDATGRRIQQVRLPERMRIVGFGSNAIYVVRRDEFDLERLQRYGMVPDR